MAQTIGERLGEKSQGTLDKLKNGTVIAYGPVDLCYTHEDLEFSPIPGGPSLPQAGLYLVFPDNVSNHVNKLAPYVHLAPPEGAKNMLESLFLLSDVYQDEFIFSNLEELKVNLIKDSFSYLGPFTLHYYEEKDLPKELEGHFPLANGDLAQEGLWMEMPSANYGITLRINPPEFLASPLDTDKVLTTLIERCQQRQKSFSR